MTILLDFKAEFVTGSGITPSLFECAVRVVSDVEQGPGGEVTYPIHEALNWKVTRFGLQARPTLQGAMLLQEDGSVWQVKLTDPRQENGKLRKYETPVGAGCRAYLPPVPPEIRQKIATRYGVEVPSDGKFWPWVFSQPSIPITLTEGAKKGLSLLSEGIVAIALMGCTGGYRTKDEFGQLAPPELIADLQLIDFEGRRVDLAFDADTKEKGRIAVNTAVSRLTPLLKEKGASVYRLLWSASQGKGIDDFKVAQGSGAIGLLYRNAKPQTVKKLTSLQKATWIAESVGLRYNELTLDVERGGQSVDIEELRVTILNQMGWQIGKDDWIDGCLAVAKGNSFHPVRDYLLACEQQYGTGDSILNDLALRYFGQSDEIYQQMVRKWLIGAVSRALAPGCKMDYALILVGAQGVGKTSWFQSLVPEGFFSNSLQSQSDKDEILKLYRAWIHEWGELETVFKRKDLSSVKNFLTQTSDFVRKPYERATKELKRYSVFCGSSNEDDFLSDCTGNRRFWVLPVTSKVPVELLERERDRIWAAAVSCYRAGEKPFLSPLHERQAAESAALFTRHDPWTGDIREWLEMGLNTRVTTAQIFTLALKQEIGRMAPRDHSRIAAILKQNGWERRQFRENGDRSWYYVRGYDTTDSLVTPEISMVTSPLVTPESPEKPLTVTTDTTESPVKINSMVTPENQSQQTIQATVTIDTIENLENLGTTKKLQSASPEKVNGKVLGQNSLVTGDKSLKGNAGNSYGCHHSEKFTGDTSDKTRERAMTLQGAMAANMPDTQSLQSPVGHAGDGTTNQRPPSWQEIYGTDGQGGCHQ